ncbi:uncharacterized protein NEMAJ01_0829 [Nematocida major]|uniref:uncharacterized protein n=1 Tax=Nematocida major TaxID=1912982 RepID=UPI0020074150|nr:uncharacterized protein NEMAJ01_0829 [Nematocida major]KAH9385933.1 hypothetical protein NEMAJ01_0829 [Nematocida major]
MKGYLMKKYQASKKVILGTACIGLFLSKIYADAGAAIGGGGVLAFAQTDPNCSPSFMNGTGFMNGMGVNGMGGASPQFKIASPTLCIKEGRQNTNFKLSPQMKRMYNKSAILSLLRLPETECKIGQVSPKTQACFLFKAIQRKAKTAATNLTFSKNAIFLEVKGKLVLMVTLERFESTMKTVKKRVPLSKVIKANKKITLNEFDDILNKIGSSASLSKRSKCAECLKTLHNELSLGDVECDVCNDVATIPISV